MLENMRRQGASIAVYFIFSLLIVIFVLNFGPQRGNRNDSGCRTESNQVISVDGSEVSWSAFQVAYLNGYNGRPGKNKTYYALEMLIRRELLVHEAQVRGLIVTDDMIDHEITSGRFFYGGQRYTLPGAVDDDGTYVHAAVKGWAGSLNVSLNSYREEQKRSLLAHMMAQVLSESVQVSRDEAFKHFLFANDTVAYDVVPFRAEPYRGALKLTDADLDRYAASHDAELQQKFKDDGKKYVHLRQIFVAKDAAKPDAAATKLGEVRAAIAAGKQKFADAANELASGATKNGGELGWYRLTNVTLDEPAVTDAVSALTAGSTTPVIKTERGAYLVTAEKDGEPTFDQVKRALARDVARDVWSKEAAKRAALAALEQVKATPDASLDKLYEHAAATPPSGGGPDIQQILNNKSLTDEQKKQILQQLIQQQQEQGAPGEEHGALEIEGADQPAGWYAAAGDPTAPATGSAVATGSAATTGSAAGGSAPVATPPVVVKAPIAATSETLPAIGEVAKPKVTRYGPAPRGKMMPGLGANPEATTALFDELGAGGIAKTVYEVNGDYVLVQVVAHNQPNVTDFDKDAAQQVDQLRRTRGAYAVESWLKGTCEQLVKDNKIRPNAELITESDDKGKPLPIRYRPCASFR